MFNDLENMTLGHITSTNLVKYVFFLFLFFFSDYNFVLNIHIQIFLDNASSILLHYFRKDMVPMDYC